MNYSVEIFRKLLRVLFEPKLNTSSYFFFQTLNYKFLKQRALPCMVLKCVLSKTSKTELQSSKYFIELTYKHPIKHVRNMNINGSLKYAQVI